MSRGDHFTAGNSSQGKLRPEGQEGVSQVREWKSVSGKGDRTCKGTGVRDHVGCHWIHSNSVLPKRRVAGGVCRDEGGGVSKGTCFSFSGLGPGPPCPGRWRHVASLALQELTE